jgi:hypothetical protein
VTTNGKLTKAAAHQLARQARQHGHYDTHPQPGPRRVGAVCPLCTTRTVVWADYSMWAGSKQGQIDQAMLDHLADTHGYPQARVKR